MKEKNLSVEAARLLGDDLIRALEPVCGDGPGIDAVARKWVDVLGPHDFARVCMVVVRATYAECLIPTPISDLPPGRLALVAPDGDVA